MDVNFGPEDVQAHGAALRVPTGEAGAPRRLPNQLGASWARLLPQRPVGMEAFCWINLASEPVPGSQLIKVVAAEFAVPFEGAGVEVHRTVGADVGVAAGD